MTRIPLMLLQVSRRRAEEEGDKGGLKMVSSRWHVLFQMKHMKLKFSCLHLVQNLLVSLQKGTIFLLQGIIC